MEKTHMKYLSKVFASASIMLATSGVAHANGAELAVNGSIKPGAPCHITVAGARIELGTIRRDTLNQDPSKPTILEDKRVDTIVGCPNPMRFALVVTEAGGTDGNDAFAFNLHPAEGDKIPGKISLLFDTDSTRIDSKQGYATGSSAGISDLEHATWGPATSSRENLPIPNGLYAVGFVPTEGSTDAPGNIKDLTVKLLLRPTIKPVNELDLSGPVVFSSDIGLEIRYF
jgi:hypothetical protein